ncbi:MAG: hypothetical protein N2038_02895 [Geminicoccaceae bacterium]|nr:hypothetical protein [Geminicoccaceae bacterium]MCS7267494.1 hypothetical protein [Geminicoccaceae bacterium]MCX7629176.1 hypothetical protein [Geminicoccaceae bacterium]MDW8123698.1 hypothetical protein [Geminicoccaceae bacterium]MDW8342023.1 hypothetical protein [Geminicoccaceae bacterium]
MMIRADDIGRLIALPRAANDDRASCHARAVASAGGTGAGIRVSYGPRASGNAAAAARTLADPAHALEPAEARGWSLVPAFSWPLGPARLASSSARAFAIALAWGELGLASAAGCARLAASGLEVASAAVAGLLALLLGSAAPEPRE